MIFNEIKCHVNTCLGLVEGNASPASPLCPRLVVTITVICYSWAPSSGENFTYMGRHLQVATSLHSPTV